IRAALTCSAMKPDTRTRKASGTIHAAPTPACSSIPSMIAAEIGPASTQYQLAPASRKSGSTADLSTSASGPSDIAALRLVQFVVPRSRIRTRDQSDGDDQRDHRRQRVQRDDRCEPPDGQQHHAGQRHRSAPESLVAAAGPAGKIRDRQAERTPATPALLCSSNHERICSSVTVFRAALRTVPNDRNWGRMPPTMSNTAAASQDQNATSTMRGRGGAAVMIGPAY